MREDFGFPCEYDTESQRTMKNCRYRGPPLSSEGRQVPTCLADGLSRAAEQSK